MRRKMFLGAGKLLLKEQQKLRKQQTFAEELLWSYLKTKPFGFNFRRQQTFSVYILDFYCHCLQLAIEVDDSIHNVDSIKRNDEIRLKQEEVIHQIDTFLKGKLDNK